MSPNIKKLFFLAAILLAAPLGAWAATTQLFDHLRALADTRYRVGDAGVTVTNVFGADLEGPKDIAVADLDGDGKQDFAAANKDGSVTVYFGNGDSTFSGPLNLRTWTNAPADSNGLFIIKFDTNICASVWTNSWIDHGTNNTNWAWVCVPGVSNIITNVVAISDGPVGLRGLALADFTGDGLRDIAVASPGESVIYLLVNHGARNFGPAIKIPAWMGVRDLAAGDFDGDGLIDLAASGTTNGMAQYRSLGGGAFQVVTNVPGLGTKKLDDDFPQPAYYLKAFHPTNSVRDELVMSRASGGEVRVLAANSSGRLELQNTLSNVLVHALDVGPLLHANSSGVLDLVSVNHDDDSLEIRAAVANNTRFQTNAAYNIAVPGRAHGVAIADLDNDGWNDLVVVLQRFAKVRVLRNNHGTFEVMSELAVGAGPRELAVGDFNGDGRIDAAVLNRVSEDVSVLIAHPTAFGFGTLDMLYPSDGEVVSLQVFDFNGDGRADVVQLHRTAGEMSVRLARTNGTLSEPIVYSLGSKPSDTRVVDLNHDGILDIIAVDLGGYVTARLGVGDGTFGPEIKTSLREYADGSWGGGALFSLTTGDFNGDGNVDLAVGYLDCRVGFFQGNGDGTFLHTHTHLLGYETHGLATGDFDGDGDIDLVATPYDGSLIIVNNPGNLLTATNIVRTFVNNGQANYGAWTVLITDYNHDGDPDLLVDGNLGYSLYLGGPGLTFTWATNILKQYVNASISPVTADFNNDGLQDIAAACVGVNCVSFSLGHTGGGFDNPFFIPVPASALIATGDLDGDGLPDLVGTGEVLWTALSSRPPQPTVPPPPNVGRVLAAKPFINEILADNQTIALAADGGRKSDFVEIFNGGGLPLPMPNWVLRLERTNSAGVKTTNIYHFPTNAIIDAGGHLVIVCSDKVRTPFHTGFNLPAEGATVCLVRADSSEADRVNYPGQEPDHSYGRFQDGVNGFMVTDTPTPGAANANTGLNPPQLTLDSVDVANLQPDQPIRFFAHATDDLGIVNLSVLWRRLDVADEVSKRVILYDDGMHGDGGSQDGLFSGVLNLGLPEGAEIQFYLECVDLSGQTDTSPGNPRFVAGGQTPLMHTLAIGIPRPALEISEVLARNVGGLHDEAGGTPDWIEIRNCSAQPVSLAGVTLAQKFFGSSERISFTNATLAAGQHIVLFADNNSNQGPLHAPFKMNTAGDQLILTGETPKGGRYLIDSVSFGPQANNISVARLGCGGPWVSSVPTPRAGNVPGSWRGLVRDGNFLLAFPTRAGANYTVEFKDDLNVTGWSPMPTSAGLGLEQAVEVPLGTQRFFRVREQ